MLALQILMEHWDDTNREITRYTAGNLEKPNR
jgi:hypothetical protein